MKEKKQINRWVEDTMILVSREARAKLKINAILYGKDLKEYLNQVALQNPNLKKI